MSRYFPHPEYAEDQPLARTILTTHVETRAITTGAIIGAGMEAFRQMRKAPVPNTLEAPRSQVFFRAVGKSTLWTIGIVSAGLVGRMWGRDEVEWKDRSWRLLESKGQLETDDWSYGGMLAGLAATALLKRPAGWVATIGSVGIGSAMGVIGYMGWRYGLHGGKFPSSE
ncbi:hypothetical protein F5B22DRAFT_589510 [Xylaria bambusicola]|uniref:uncharacterized protein n=1 Tax=Xylaria bambusicola TaxID=326684 RepID=UPI00200815E6|nr:uncharacterized protein F5B22DRAFT_589510 [Xylaria bambusicola]KAI0525340.1 hypothetical protein F5B22DRAFT_589510 [Xylaria bambusicola]